MRIISGTHKGRTVIAPSGFPVRPTTDLAKESLFNILGNNFDFENLVVLDLFAGIGSISYEFASRGAAEVIAVDMNFKCADFIRKTSQNFGLKTIRTVRFNVFNFLETVHKKFDIVFADPPYDIRGLERLPDLVLQKNILNEGGWFILEHPAEHDFSKHPNLLEHRKYSKVNFSIFGNTVTTSLSDTNG
jgi:16S rRNA (guanine966-N2)-methyltransferase